MTLMTDRCDRITSLIDAALAADAGPYAALRHHVTGAVERGEAASIAEIRAPESRQTGDPDVRWVYEVLVTDTLVWEVVGRTASTLRVRRARDIGEPQVDERCDKGGFGTSVVWQPVGADDTAPVRIVRRRKDGTYRVSSWCALRPVADQANPARRIDYRF